MSSIVSAGIAGVGGMRMPADEVSQQPAIDGAKGQFSGLGAAAGTGYGVEDSAQFAAGQIGIQQQAGLLPDGIFLPIGAQLRAQVRSAPVLPDDGVVDRSARGVLPDDGGPARVADADTGNQGGIITRPSKHLQRDIALRVPDVYRVMFDPSRLRKVLREFLLRDVVDRPGGVEQDGPRDGGSLIQGEDGLHRGLHVGLMSGGAVVTGRVNSAIPDLWRAVMALIVDGKPT